MSHTARNMRQETSKWLRYRLFPRGTKRLGLGRGAVLANDEAKSLVPKYLKERRRIFGTPAQALWAESSVASLSLQFEGLESDRTAILPESASAQRSLSFRFPPLGVEYIPHISPRSPPARKPL